MIREGCSKPAVAAGAILRGCLTIALLALAGCVTGPAQGVCSGGGFEVDSDKSGIVLRAFTSEYIQLDIRRLGYAGAIDLSLEPAPQHAVPQALEFTFYPNPVGAVPGNYSGLDILAQGEIPQGLHQLRIRATGGGTSCTLPLTVTVL